MAIDDPGRGAVPSDPHVCARPAPGGPGIEPRWSRSAKDAVGTAYSASSRIWFTVARGIVTEVYHPTIDRPQVRDLQYLVTDGATFFHEERRHLSARVEALSANALGYRVVGEDPAGRYRIRKEVLAAPHEPCLLLRTRLEAIEGATRPLKLFVLLAPHLDGGGADNTGYVIDVAGRRVLVAHKGGVWLALGATPTILRGSGGYVGVNDGWTDLATDFRMDWAYDCVHDGNIGLTAEIDLREGPEHVLGLAFGDTFHGAVTALFQALATPFDAHEERFLAQWDRAAARRLPLERAAEDGGALYRRSHALLLAHEDKTYGGAIVASLSIPWGEDKGDEDLGAYHLVWTRDLVQAATGLLAAGNHATPLRSLVYLAASQRPDGGFPQNFWIDGEPFWGGIQLDEVAFPILLAWHLRRLDALARFDPWPMVLRAAGFLVRAGPATQQERWEEEAGFSPSTLAATISALVCASVFARERGDVATAAFLEEHADWLDAHVEDWTVTSRGSLLAGVPRHYVRILPRDLADPDDSEDPDRAVLRIDNQAPGAPTEFPARNVVDAGFLELVRYGVRAPRDPLVEDSLRVVDAVLRVDTPLGPSWHRYNHDGYGETEDGGPFRRHGVGRAWPLLTGERGHYELAAGRPVEPFVRALEAFATGGGLLPEQVWDADDRPEISKFRGRPTGGAMPLVWAHAEYVKLLRSRADGRVFDRIPEVAARCASGRPRASLEVWTPTRHAKSAPAGGRLRIVASRGFLLRVSLDEWASSRDLAGTPTALGVEFVDVELPAAQRAPVRFTFRWTDEDRWEGRDYAVATAPP